MGSTARLQDRSAVLLLLLAAGLIAASCGGPATAQELEVTFYYLPG